MKLEPSVGQKMVARNRKEDVLTAQRLLNGLVIDPGGSRSASVSRIQKDEQRQDLLTRRILAPVQPVAHG